MAIAFTFEFPGGTQAQYDQILEKLQQSGTKAPGRLFHLAGPMENGWRVIDVWESKEALDKFFEVALGRLIQESEFPQPQIIVTPARNVLTGTDHHL